MSTITTRTSRPMQPLLRPLQALRDEQRALPGQLAALRQELDRTAFDRNITRDLQADKRRLPALEEQVQALQVQMTAGEARLATLPSLVVQAQQVLDAAIQRRQAAMQAHWQWLEAQRDAEGWDAWTEGNGDLVRWVCAVNCHASHSTAGDPPAPMATGLRSVSQGP